jgi:hypothetical protein
MTALTRARVVMSGAALALVLASDSPAWAITCTNANPNDGNPDDAALNACLSNGGTVTLVSGSVGYIVAHPVSIIVSGTSLVGPAAGLANFIAKNDLTGYMLQALDVDNVTLQNLWFDGNKGNRTVSCNPDDGTGKNVVARGNNVHVDNVGSISALCGSALEVYSDGLSVTNSYFASNGYAYPTGPWADGLTVWGCLNGSVHDNTFSDNTDVDLIVGGGNCSVYSNTISHPNVRGLAGLMVGQFPGLNGNHSGATYHDNTITSSLNKLSFGLLVGQHPWTMDGAKQVSDLGSVFSNGVSGAVVNLAVDGVSSGTVSGNNPSSPQGTLGYPCTYGANYTYAHQGTAGLQAGAVPFRYDVGLCSP